MKGGHTTVQKAWIASLHESGGAAAGAGAHAALAVLRRSRGPTAPRRSAIYCGPSSGALNGILGLPPKVEEKPDAVCWEVVALEEFMDKYRAQVLALQEFMDKYGDDAKELRDKMLDTMARTEKSLAAIQSWNQSWGLRT